MTSAEEFNCILCKETFNNKDELQNHFRKHGDPKFNESIKTKSRVQNEATFAIEKSNDASEMVNCDVCDEVFPTISKAITHKHKVHPEHDAKYFCPWCGKLFTMKHLYNKHLHANHDASDEVLGSKDSHFHCDSCDVYFFVPAAMVYHNKFFHRQDSDLPIIGHSKKQTLVNQDLLPVYYCSFCGEEYINKVNLHKHMCDDHGDENQRPTDVLRCPLCEAVFYHLDAYELHLTFHSSEDLYSETNEMNETEMTEFSLETVPPVMERIEDLNNLPDVETDMNAVGIESFLQMAMDEPKDCDQLHGKVRSKKHKKHKKSKKPAITLDEFLSMNQDVFGEDLDFQGIEEVPTKVITKQLKIKKPPISKKGVKNVASADLKKLQKLGIAVKVKSGNKPPVSKVKTIGQPIKINPHVKNPAVKTKTNAISASNEVLSKLLTQSSNQLKIVKKSTKEKETGDESHGSEFETQHLKDVTEITPNTIMSSKEKEENGEDHESNVTQAFVSQISPTNNQDSNDNDSSQHIDSNEEILNNQTDNANSKVSNNACIKPIKSPNVNYNAAPAVSTGNYMCDTLKNIGNQITIKPISQAASRFEGKSDDLARPDKNESDVEKDQTWPAKDLNEEKNEVDEKNKGIDPLKNLNRAITIKTLKNITGPGSNKSSITNNDKTEKMFKQSNLHSPVSNPVKQLKLETSAENVNKCDKIKDYSPPMASPSQVLKNFSKNITIKPMSPQIKHSKVDVTNDKHNDNDFDNHEGIHTTSPSQVLKNISKSITIKSMSPQVQHSKEDVTNDDHYDSDFDNHEDIHMMSPSEVLKNISQNITKKSMSPQAQHSKEDYTNDDHYDSYFDNHEDMHKTSPSKVLKNISKNVTIKSISPQVQNSKEDVTTDEHYDSDFDNHEDIHKTSPSEVLKNISKNITIKSMSSQVQQTKEDVTNNDSDYDHEDHKSMETQNTNFVASSAPDTLKNVRPGYKINSGISMMSTAHIPYANNRAVAKSKDNVTGDEMCTKDKEFKNRTQSSNNLLKHLTNITAKPVPTSKIINQEIVTKSSNKTTNIAKEATVIKQSMQTKEVHQEIEIFNIDDSDDEEEQPKTNKVKAVHIKKEPIKADVNSPRVLNAIKNMSKHITVKPSNNPTSQNAFTSDEEMHDDENFDSNYDSDQNITAHISKLTSSQKITTDKNNSFNVLKQLGKHITVKSKNTPPNQSIKSLNHVSHDFNPDITANDAESDEEYTGKVKITEVTEDEDGIDDTDNYNDKGIVTQSPDDSISGDEHFTEGIEEPDESYSQNLKVRLNDNLNPNNEGLLRNISKNITIKSLSEKTADTEDRTCKTVSSENESIGTHSKLRKELLIKPTKQNNPDVTNDSERCGTSTMPINKRMENTSTSSPSSLSVHPKVAKPGEVNTVNKEVKVKTFQSETVIEEITTTVTKTIRRVNQTVTNQQVFNASQMSSPRMIKPQAGPRMGGIRTSNNLQGVTVRQSAPVVVRPKIRQAVPLRPASGTIVRPSNQLVPIRPGVTPIRPNNAPRMQIKNMPRQPRPVGRPLKISPNVVNQTLKRPANNEEQPGHFSCFKKPKESLIPLNEEPSSTFQYVSSSQTSKFCSTTQTVKGNSVVTSTQMKSESLSQQQQINRLGNIAGLKVAKASQVSRVEKIEMNASKRNTLEAIEKLQKQGLLIKKPRVEEESDLPYSDGEDDEQRNDYDD